jgi:hypothetical protein
LYEFILQFLKKVVRVQRWPTAPLLVVIFSLAFVEFTSPLCHILPINNITIYSNNL